MEQPQSCSSSGGVGGLNNLLVYCACADPLYKGMEKPQSCSSSGGVGGLNNSLLCTAHAQIHCIKEWSNRKTARAQEE